MASTTTRSRPAAAAADPAPAAKLLDEASEAKPDAAAAGIPATDALAEVLANHVSDVGWVDYAALAEDPSNLDRYIASLADVDLEGMKKDRRLATLLNAYNAFTLKLIVENYNGGELESIEDIPEDERFEAQRWKLAGQTVSLNQIENELIRPNFDEPRIHWALVCAAYSCPPAARRAVRRRGSG